MTAPAAGLAIDVIDPVPCAVLSSGAIPNVNPRTGLSTDYLNHFTEAVMVLEMITTMPECVDDLIAWQPKSYCEHFATSRFGDRDAVIAAYRAADPAVRDALEAAAETLNAVLGKTRSVVVAYRATPEAEMLALRAVAWLKPLIARTAAVINGTATGPLDRLDGQAAIDAMFGQ
jgi:hypothetical protein